MATGRPQKGMNRRNHHDSISQSVRTKELRLQRTNPPAEVHHF